MNSPNRKLKILLLAPQTPKRLLSSSTGIRVEGAANRYRPEKHCPDAGAPASFRTTAPRHTGQKVHTDRMGPAAQALGAMRPDTNVNRIGVHMEESGPHTSILGSAGQPHSAHHPKTLKCTTLKSPGVRQFDCENSVPGALSSQATKEGCRETREPPLKSRQISKCHSL